MRSDNSTMIRRVLPLLFALFPILLAAADDPPRHRTITSEAADDSLADRADVEGGRHYVLQTSGDLDAASRAALRSEGIEIQRPLTSGRYLVRVKNAKGGASNPPSMSLTLYDPSEKIARSAYTQAARSASFGRFNVVFHEDVTFDDAVRAIAAAGGTLESPLALSYQRPRRLQVRLPTGALTMLAGDERVFGIFGPQFRPHAVNAVAASLSHVTPLFSAPYNLTGEGVVLSIFELAAADTTHVQFGGRYTSTFTGGAASDVAHATHTAGTMIASGIDPNRSDAASAKGMAPAATLQEFNALQDLDALLVDKEKLVTTHSVGDNNSWDFSLGWQGMVWYDFAEYLGAYSLTESSPYDHVAVEAGIPLLVHAAGNDASNGHPDLPSPWSQHQHTDENSKPIQTETFCYSQNGSGTDCPAPMCTPGKSLKTGEPHCETPHPPYGPYGTIGLMASTKNTLSVGAVDASGVIGYFSSRGPTRDGRVKPELVAKGLDQFSTFPGGKYATIQGTSMSTPVVAGITALVVQQWRKTFLGQTPSAAEIKTLLIAGADDRVGPANLDLPGPDYTYGFGLVDAKASIDLIIADNATGSRIRTGSVSSGQEIEYPLTLGASQNVRVVLGWFDPEVFPSPTSLDAPSLLNDLDVRVIDPAGNTVLPYVLDRTNPQNAATQGVNTIDTTEELEIKGAAAGVYRVIVKGSKIGDTRKTSQDFVLVANAPLVVGPPPCADAYEPNDTPATAFAAPNGSPLTARLCPDTDRDYYKFTVIPPVTGRVTAMATDTRIKMTLFSGGQAVASRTIAAGTTDSITFDFPQIVSAPGANAMSVLIEPAGTVGPLGTYTLTVAYTPPPISRHRPTNH